MTEISKGWERLTRELFSHIDDALIASFRSPGPRNKFVGWDPSEPSSRHFKFLLFTTALKQSPAFFEAYKALRHRDVGNPMTVRCRGCDIDADYLAAVGEWEFLHDAHALDDVRTVVEIGAGFGRTCHTLLTLCPGIATYVIVDLDPMLALSRAYLARAMPGTPVTFVSHNDLERLDAIDPDLVINIDSFQEMLPQAIDFYMTRVVQRARRFYCKNPVGKYLPAAAGLPEPGPERVQDIFTLGYCQDVVDIFDEDALRRARDTFVKAYCPPNWRVTASKPMDLFPYFQHVLYVRDHPTRPESERA